jgi:hypothetical protein
VSHRTPLDADPNARKRAIAWTLAITGAAILIAAVCCGILGAARDDDEPRDIIQRGGVGLGAATCATVRC